MSSLLISILTLALIGQSLGAMTQFSQGDTYIKLSSYGKIVTGKDQTQEPDESDSEETEWMPPTGDPSEVKVQLMSVSLLDSNNDVIVDDAFDSAFHLDSMPEMAPQHPGILTQKKGMGADVISSGAKIWFGASAVVASGTLHPGKVIEEKVDEKTVLFDVKFVRGDAECQQCDSAEALELNLQLSGQEPYKVALHPEPGTKKVEMGGGMTIVLPGRYIAETSYPTCSVDVKQESGSKRPVVNVKVVLPLAGNSDVTWGGRIKFGDPNTQENQVLPQDGGDDVNDDADSGAASLKWAGSVTLLLLLSISMML